MGLSNTFLRTDVQKGGGGRNEVAGKLNLGSLSAYSASPAGEGGVRLYLSQLV
jgi:hypothetical protein